jgi:hypothetical protein
MGAGAPMGVATAAAVAELHDESMTASIETLTYKLTLGSCILAGSGRCCVLDQSVVAVHWPRPVWPAASAGFLEGEER